MNFVKNILFPAFVVALLTSLSLLAFLISYRLTRSNNAIKQKDFSKVQISEGLHRASNAGDSEIVLIATGDVMLGRAVNFQIDRFSDTHLPFRKVKNLLENADICYINLENPFVDPCPTSTLGMVFCAPTSSVKSLSYAGVDVVNLANNHTRNYGQQGYGSTIESLEAEGIFFSDSGTVAQISVGDTSFGFLGFDLVSRNWLDGEIVARVVSAKKGTDVLVVGFHWGQEYAYEPTDKQKEVARLVVDSGADLVIGHHPHVVQPVEVYNNVPVAYSLGNFIFDQGWSEKTKKGVVGKFYFKNKKLSDYEFIPIYIGENSQPEVVTDSEMRAEILSIMEM